MQFGKPVIAKPVAGKKVRKEDGSMLPEGGATVTHSSYYLRRKNEGVLNLTEAVETKAPAVASEPAEKKSGK